MPLEIVDETGGTPRLTVADGGTRIGVNGSPGSSAAVSVGGVDFIAGNAHFAANTVISASVNPVTGAVTISGSATITTTGFECGMLDNSGDITALSSGSWTVAGSGSTNYAHW